MNPEMLLVKRERIYSAHHALLSAAHMALEKVKEKESGWFYHELIAITFSALALEAISNAFGDCFVPNWKNFQSSTPAAKLQTVAEKLNVDVGNFSAEPWSGVPWLIGIRNKIVHAKPQKICFEKIVTRSEYEKMRYNFPPSSIESEISSSNAERAVSTVEAILELLLEKVGIELVPGLLSDGCAGSAQTLHPSEIKNSNYL